jgi:GDP-L-fucose synthase
MKILVTGGSGLIGMALKNYVNSISHKNTDEWIYSSSKECNLLKVDEVAKMFNNIKPDYVIHLAAEVGGLFKNMNDKVKMLENNILMNFNVLKTAHEINIHNVMCCLSTCIFPDKVEYPISEDSLHNGPPHNSNYAYAYAKRVLDIHCRVYREQYNRNYFCIIPTNVYGPHDNFNLQDGHVIPALIHQCYLAKLNKKPFYVKGTGRPLRQFIYSNDIAKCIYHLISTYNDNKPVILSVSEKDEVSIGYIAKLIAESMNYECIEFLSEYADGQYKKTVNNNYLLSLMPTDFKFTPIEQGIKESVDWFCKNKEDNSTNIRL